MQRYQVLDQLSLLVDKSLVVVDEGRDRTRFRLLPEVAAPVRARALADMAVLDGWAGATNSMARD